MSMSVPNTVAVLFLVVGMMSSFSTARKFDRPQCQPSNTTCYANPDNRFTSSPIDDPADCCAMCFKTLQCASYTAYKTTETQQLMCNLFRNVQGATNGHGCVSGIVIPGSRPKPMNFVFVFPDTLRAESHGGYTDGDHPTPKNVTPYLDNFAKQGVRFHQAHVMHTQCSPSRCTMLTGRYMHVLGHRTQTHLVQDYEMNYLRALKDAGYHTAMYGKNDAFSSIALNLSLSFWENDIGYGSGGNAFTYPEAGTFSFLSTGSNTSGADYNISGDYRGVVKALEFMSNSPPEPFSLFLTSRGAHPPYGAPLEWHNKYSPEDVKASGWTPRGRSIAGMPTYMQNDTGIPHFRNLTYLDEDFFYKIQAVYLGMISYTDWIFGQLLEGLDNIEDGKLAARTAVFFSSDHGDFGGDYGLVEKWPGSMADVLTRVPLYARIPGGAQGHVSMAPVQTADVFETMLDIANINMTDWIRFGKSLLPQLHGGEGAIDRFVFSEGGFYFANEQMNEANECLRGCPTALYCPRGEEESQPNGSPRAAMIRNTTSKLVHRPTGVSELYDLVSDPRETKNLWGTSTYNDLQSELLSALLDWYVLTSDVTPEQIDSRGAAKYPYMLPNSDPWATSEAQGTPSPMDYLTINGVVEE